MVIAITLPDLVYVYLSYALPESLIIVNVCVFIEQFGYGFGFSAYMLYLIYYSQGEHKTAHYALCTAFMALSMMIKEETRIGKSLPMNRIIHLPDTD